MQSNIFKPTRRVRRHIPFALAGAALGTVCMAMPSHADVSVNNTNDSGAGSLSQAITDSGHIVFEALLTNGVTFSSTLPSIVNGLSIDSSSGLNNFTVTPGLTTDSGSYLDLTGDSTLGDYNITSDLTAKGISEIYISNAYTVNGNLAVDGSYDNQDRSLISVNNSQVNGTTVNATHGGLVHINTGSIKLSGDATANGVGSNGIYSEISVTGSSLNATNLYAINGGKITVSDNFFTGGFSNATLLGDATADGVGSNGITSEISVFGSNFSATNLTATNGGYIVLDSDGYGVTVTLSGNVTADGAGSDGQRSQIDVRADNLSAANFIASNGGYIILDNYEGFGTTVALSGDATADGGGSNGVPSEIDMENNSTLVGNAIATNGGYLYVDGGSTITGHVTVDSKSLLRTGHAIVGGTATFNSNAVFAPNIFPDSTSVNSLVANNTAQIRPWLDAAFGVTTLPPMPVGSGNGGSVIDYNSITGAFDPNVISPLDMGVEYADSIGTITATPNTSDSGEVQLYLKSNQVNFNKLPGAENAQSLGSFLNRVINQSNTNPNEFTLSNLPTEWQDPAYDAIQNASYDGNLNFLNGGIPTNYSSHNAQAYWNQKSFVDSILANLDNGCNMEDSSHAFALNQVSGASGTGAQLASLREATTSGFNQLNYAGDKGSNSSGVWASYNGNHQHTDADSGIGSSDWSSSSDGFTLGYTSGGDKFSWGAAVGHQKSTLNFADLNANGNQDGYNAGLSASLKGKAGYLNGVLSYGNFDNDSYGGAGDATFKTKATAASLEVGKQISNSKSSSLTSYASVLWTRIKQGDATVTGNLPGLTLNSGTNSIFTTELGIRYNHRMYDKDDILKGGWQAGLAWLHQGGDTGFPVNLGSSLVPGAGTFAIQSTPLAGNSAVVQLGAYGRIHGNLIGFAGYQGTFGSSQKINAVNAGVGYQF